ncbi:hypothetical protein LCGC14_2156780 [marine sediment metagenome]|uniref:Uncharacterized protein n=1 Tax=marine sediment metagenome TaxID=412755 RepID=A0A0F9G708_9ZZZZ
MKQSKEEVIFLERIAFRVIKPKWAIKLHGGFMHDGTPMDEIKTIAEFITYSKKGVVVNK